MALYALTMKSIRKSHPIIIVLNNSLVDLPSPSNISYIWNFGSILGIILFIQIFSGLFLAIHFCADHLITFSTISHIMRDTNIGSLIRIIHANGASLFFLCIYFHIGRGIYYNSFYLIKTWVSGIIVLIILIATAFIGYVLPWGQMSFWGATVITNLLSAIPYIGSILVEWLWGGFSVNNATLTRFFTFHFLLPFILVLLVIIHLTNLHLTGSNNPLGISSFFKISFHPYFLVKDLLGFIFIILILLIVSLEQPYYFGDPENFSPSNPMVTPIHIQPEWYFLFAYAILRSIPNKLGGVLALFLSIFILIILPILKNQYSSFSTQPREKILFWSFVNLFFLLTWIGARPVEPPYIIIGQIFTILYFLYFIYPFVLKKN